MTRPSDEGRCDLCGEPMPEGESMFRMHGYSGPCPKPPLPVTTPTHCACVWHGQADGPPFSECHYHATLRADLAAARAEEERLDRALEQCRALLGQSVNDVQPLRDKLAAAKDRIAQRDAQIAVYNSGGFADADALAEKFWAQSADLAAARETLENIASGELGINLCIKHAKAALAGKGE
jgi:hypothetical protein